MEQHADEPLTPQELARVGCMSVCTLHTTFQQALGESPMSYLRRIRLDHVRAELQRSDPSLVWVTDVAIRWGFLRAASPSSTAIASASFRGRPSADTRRLPPDSDPSSSFLSLPTCPHPPR